jgi:starch synthase
MSKPLNVLFLSSEVDPFAKTGGLADVSAALPLSVRAMDHEVRVMMPRYGSINERRSKLHEMIRLKDFPIPVGTKEFHASVKSSFLETSHTKVQVYFVDNPTLFGRSGLYVHPETKKDYEDNDERFIFFCRSVFEVLKRLGWAPDLIHCNDWPTGLVPAYLKTLYAADPFFKDTRTVFTIHNMAYQGIFPASSFPKTLLPAELFGPNGMEAYGKLNFLKAGLVFADALTTVSERYAEEIRTSEEIGAGLQGLVQKRKDVLYGILNGVDYSQWDPSADQLIPQRFDARTMDLKLENKKALCAAMGLPFQEQTPIIGMISRLADQKGFDLVGEVMEDLVKMNLQLVVLGTGEKRYHDLFERAARKHPKQVAVKLGFDNDLAHLIEAGSDIFLMPSKYEPCGLNQIYSLRYGTVPVVRATGGLEDTIDDYTASHAGATGFKFHHYTGAELLKAVGKAVHLFADHAAWRRIMKNGMAKDFSWEASAKKYVALYRSLAKH